MVPSRAARVLVSRLPEPGRREIRLVGEAVHAGDGLVQAAE